MNTRPGHGALAVLALSSLLSLPVASVAQEGLPKRKPGLWEVSMQMPGRSGMPAMSSRQCVDAQSDEQMQREALSGNDPEAQCRQLSSRQVGGGHEIEVECKSRDGGTTRVSSRLTGDMQARYNVDSTATFTPPRHGMSSARMTMTATHRGACPAGMKPGEVQMGAMAMPGGMSVDLEKLRNMSPEQQRKWAEQMQRRGGKP